MSDEIIIVQKALKGEDGYKNISLRIHEKSLKRLDDLSYETNQSRNALVNVFVEYGLNHYKIKSKDE